MLLSCLILGYFVIALHSLRSVCVQFPNPCLGVQVDNFLLPSPRLLGGLSLAFPLIGYFMITSISFRLLLPSPRLLGGLSIASPLIGYFMIILALASLATSAYAASSKFHGYLSSGLSRGRSYCFYIYVS